MQYGFAWAHQISKTQLHVPVVIISRYISIMHPVSFGDKEQKVLCWPTLTFDLTWEVVCRRYLKKIFINVVDHIHDLLHIIFRYYFRYPNRFANATVVVSNTPPPLRSGMVNCRLLARVKLSLNLAVSWLLNSC